MKKLIPVYVLLILMVAGIVTFGVLVLREVKTMHAELTAIKKVQMASSFGGVMQVEVVNTPTVEVDDPISVTVNEPLSVSVDNEPEVNCTNCRY